MSCSSFGFHGVISGPGESGFTKQRVASAAPTLEPPRRGYGGLPPLVQKNGDEAGSRGGSPWFMISPGIHSQWTSKFTVSRVTIPPKHTRISTPLTIPTDMVRSTHCTSSTLLSEQPCSNPFKGRWKSVTKRETLQLGPFKESSQQQCTSNGCV